MIDSAVTLLPEPDSPTIATVSRGPISNETLFDDGGPRAVDAETRSSGCDTDRDGQAPGRCGYPLGDSALSPFSFGSMASRRPSPSRLSAKITTRMAMLGTSASM